MLLGLRPADPGQRLPLPCAGHQAHRPERSAQTGAVHQEEQPDLRCGHKQAAKEVRHLAGLLLLSRLPLRLVTSC